MFRENIIQEIALLYSSFGEMTFDLSEYCFDNKHHFKKLLEYFKDAYELSPIIEISYGNYFIIHDYLEYCDTDYYLGIIVIENELHALLYDNLEELKNNEIFKNLEADNY